MCCSFLFLDHSWLDVQSKGLSEPPAAWAVIPPDLTISRHVEVLLSVDSTIYAVDNLESIDQRISRGPFSHVSPSPNGKSLALLTFSGMLWVVSTDFQRSLAEFETSGTGGDGPVRQVEWCGNDAILVAWDSLALLVGPFGDTLQYVHFLHLFLHAPDHSADTSTSGLRLRSQRLTVCG